MACRRRMTSSTGETPICRFIERLKHEITGSEKKPKICVQETDGVWRERDPAASAEELPPPRVGGVTGENCDVNAPACEGGYCADVVFDV